MTARPPPRATRRRLFVPSAAALRSKTKKAMEFHVWVNANTPLSAIALRSKYPIVSPISTWPDPTVNVYSLSNQYAATLKVQRDLLVHLRDVLTGRYPSSLRNRFRTVSRHPSHQTPLKLLVLLRELLFPPLIVASLLALAVVRVCLWIGMRAPMLSLCAFTTTSPAMVGRESLSPGENGYTRVFHGGHHVSEDDLEVELLTRNATDAVQSFFWPPITICVSYKHYAANDGNRISREDLRALCMLLKQAGPCRVRFWTDSKLPQTNDDSFERWVTRGVTPYGRYITFLCPSAMRERDNSFWVCNEFHFAVCGKGVIYLKGSELFFELRYGYQPPLYHRFLQIVTGAAPDWGHVRDADREKALRWAMCCLTVSRSEMDSHMSPKIDCLSLEGDPWLRQLGFMIKVEKVVDKFGELRLPIVRGESWNGENPLVLKGCPIVNGEEESRWFGVVVDDPSTVYFVRMPYLWLLSNEKIREVVALEVGLDKPFWSDGQVQVVSKVLRKISLAALKRATLVTVPWLCEWQ